MENEVISQVVDSAVTNDYSDILSALESISDSLKISIFVTSVLIGLMVLLIFVCAFDWRG